VDRALLHIDIIIIIVIIIIISIISLFRKHKTTEKDSSDM